MLHVIFASEFCHFLYAYINSNKKKITLTKINGKKTRNVNWYRELCSEKRKLHCPHHKYCMSWAWEKRWVWTNWMLSNWLDNKILCQIMVFFLLVSGECSFRILVVVWKCLMLIYSLTFHNQDFISVIWKWIVWCTGTHLFNVYAIWQIHFQFTSMCINQIIWFIFEYFFSIFSHHNYVNWCSVFALYFLHHDCLFFFIFIFQSESWN